MTALEQLIETAKTLPAADRRQLQAWPREREERDAEMQAAPPLVVETGRGPCIAGRRTTLYVVYQTFASTQDREFVKRHLLLTDEQLDAALAYIEQHKERFLRDYAEIVRVSEERRAHYNKLFWERSRFTPETPMEERVAVMRQLLRERREAEAGNRCACTDPSPARHCGATHVICSRLSAPQVGCSIPARGAGSCFPYAK
jgi:uncharacterized protein (DUF433 family)